MTLQLSHSELKTWRTCRRKWLVQYYLQLGPGPEESPVGSAQLGTKVHLALEGHYGYQLDPVAVLKYAYDESLAEHPEFEPELIKERDYAITMIEGYLQWSAEEGIDAGLEVLAAEREIQQEVVLVSGQPVIFRGKLDQLVRRQQDDAILWRDWKTVGSLTKANLLVLDTQTRFYSMLQALEAKREGTFRADGGLYTMLMRSKRTDRAKGPFYQQVEVHFNPNDLNSIWLHARAIAQEIMTARQLLDAGGDHREIVYANAGDHCRWMCPFVSVCPLFDDGSRWQDALAANYSHCDPYQRYSSDRILAVRKALGQGGREE